MMFAAYRRLRFERFRGERNFGSQTPNRIQIRTMAVRIGTYRQSPDSSSTRRGASGVLAGAIETSTELMTSPRRRPLAEAVAAFPLDATFGPPGARTGA
jgi:hypothetical protein